MVSAERPYEKDTIMVFIFATELFKLIWSDLLSDVDQIILEKPLLCGLQSRVAAEAPVA